MKSIRLRPGSNLCRTIKWHALAIILIGLASICFGQYKSRNSARKVFQLNEPKVTGPMSFEQVLDTQKSVFRFSGQPLDLSQIGQLAWAGQGIIDRQTGLRTAPSSGDIYPIELYFATKDGVLAYNPDNHTLEQTTDEDVRVALAAATSQPRAVADAGCNIIIAGSTRKAAVRYGKQARKYILLEAGRIAQNIRLQAMSLELASVPIAEFDIREVSSVCRLPKGSEPVYVMGVGYPVTEPLAGTEAAPTARRAALVVSAANFRDEELFETRLALNDAGVETIIASLRIGPVTGMLGGVAEAVVLLDGLRVDDFDAVVFIGGSGAVQYVSSPVALGLVREAADKGKILAAIGVAPVVLANAGVLTGVRATSILTERVKLQLAGADYTGMPVERDGPIITASDPEAANLFGKAIVDAISGR